MPFQDPSLVNCQAYDEYTRTRGLSAFNWQHNPTSKRINQYYTRTTFPDGSYVHTSGCGNKINRNTIIAFTRLGEGIAIRNLFQ